MNPEVTNLVNRYTTNARDRRDTANIIVGDFVAPTAAGILGKAVIDQTVKRIGENAISAAVTGAITAGAGNVAATTARFLIDAGRGRNALDVYAAVSHTEGTRDALSRKQFGSTLISFAQNFYRIPERIIDKRILKLYGRRSVRTLADCYTAGAPNIARLTTYQPRLEGYLTDGVQYVSGIRTLRAKGAYFTPEEDRIAQERETAVTAVMTAIWADATRINPAQQAAISGRIDTEVRRRMRWAMAEMHAWHSILGFARGAILPTAVIPAIGHVLESVKVHGFPRIAELWQELAPSTGSLVKNTLGPIWDNIKKFDPWKQYDEWKKTSLPMSEVVRSSNKQIDLAKAWENFINMPFQNPLAPNVPATSIVPSTAGQIPNPFSVVPGSPADHARLWLDQNVGIHISASNTQTALPSINQADVSTTVSGGHAGLLSAPHNHISSIKENLINTIATDSVQHGVDILSNQALMADALEKTLVSNAYNSAHWNTAVQIAKSIHDNQALNLFSQAGFGTPDPSTGRMDVLWKYRVLLEDPDKKLDNLLNVLHWFNKGETVVLPDAA